MGEVRDDPYEGARPDATAGPSGSSSFDERWEAWQAKGPPHDRAVRRTLTIAAPILVIVAAAIFYAVISR